MKIIKKHKFDWPIVGHEKVVEFLQRSIVREKYAHTYLFVGPDGVGKESVAKLFIQSSLCQGASLKEQLQNIPCNKCSVCERFSKSAHPDVFMVKKGEDKKNIGIEQIRDLQHFLNLKSFISGLKFALILDAETLSEEASNSLLKTLEEPYTNTIIVLISSRQDNLLPTITSRCQIIHFHLLSEKKIYQFLVDKGNDRVSSRNIAAIAQGRVGNAVLLTKFPDLLESYQDNIAQFIEIMNSSLPEGFSAINSIVSSKIKLQNSEKSLNQTFEIWQAVLRDLVLLKIDLNYLAVNKIKLEKLKRVAANFSLSKLNEIITLLNKIKLQLESNVNPKLVLENFIISLK